MSNVQTRLATIADVDAIAPLFDAYRQFYDMPADLALAKGYLHARLASGQSVIFVALAQSPEPVGFCQLYPTFCSVEARPILTLYDLFVQPAARRLGVAQALMLAAEQHAAQSGSARLDLSTARSNHAAQKLYEALGWVRDDVFLVYSRHLG